MITSLAYSVNTTHRFDMPSSFRVSTKCTLPTSRPRVSDSQARQDSEETWRPESVSPRDRNRNEFPSVPLDYCQTQCGVRCRKYGPAPRLPGRLDQYCKLQKAATAPGLASAPGSRRATLHTHLSQGATQTAPLVAIDDCFVTAMLPHSRSPRRRMRYSTKWSRGRDAPPATSLSLWLTSSCLRCTLETGLCPEEALNPMRPWAREQGMGDLGGVGVSSFEPAV